MPERRLLSAGELAKRLNLSIRTVQRYRASGDLDPDDVTPGGQARYYEDNARRQLEELARRARERYED